jgi:16S rRNA U1498 N3-methylase RsmE
MQFQFLIDFLQQPVVNGFVLHHRCEQTLLALTAVDEASILIGPEGGLSEIEIINLREGQFPHNNCILAITASDAVSVLNTREPNNKER